MFSSAKAVALLRDLQDKLTQRLAGGSGLNTVASGSYTDSNGAVWPYLMISHGGTVTEGSAVIYIQVSAVDMISKDIFGNQTYAYAPHIMQFAYELTAGGAPIPTMADITTCEFEAMKLGTRFQLKAIANGTAVTAAAANAASAIVDLDSLQWPTKLV